MATSTVTKAAALLVTLFGSDVFSENIDIVNFGCS
jgi:hypothetical protein